MANASLEVDVPSISDLSLLTTSLKNTVTQPGTFATTYPSTTDSDLLAVLKDGLAECHFEGLLLAYDISGTSTIVDAAGSATTMPDAAQSTVVLFASARFLRSVLLNRPSTREYVAGRGQATFHEEMSTNLLRDLLKGLKEQIARVIANDSTTSGAGGEWFGMGDQYWARMEQSYDGWSTS